MSAKRLATWLALAARDGDTCHYCDLQLRPDSFTVDHIWPRYLGGSNNRWNLVLSCMPCNSRRGHQVAKCLCRTCHRARGRSLPPGVRFHAAA